MKRIKLVQLDGKIPNLALMKLAHWHSDRGDSVTLTRSVQPRLFDEKPDLVYGSAIFTKSLRRVREFQDAYPDGILGGTGTGKFSLRTVEDFPGSRAVRTVRLLRVSGVPMVAGVHPEGMPAPLRVLRRAEEGGQTRPGQHRVGHLEARNPPAPAPPRQRLLRAAQGGMEKEDRGNPGREIQGQLQPGG